MFENAKVGEKVWDSFDRNFIKIRSISTATHDFIPINLENGKNMSFKGTDSRGRSRYYWQPFEIPPHAFEKPLPELEDGQEILVKDDPGGFWEKRHFAKYNTANKVLAYRNGQSKWSHYNESCFAWECYRLPTAEELRTGVIDQSIE